MFHAFETGMLSFSSALSCRFNGPRLSGRSSDLNLLDESPEMVLKNFTDPFLRRRHSQPAGAGAGKAQEFSATTICEIFSNELHLSPMAEAAFSCAWRRRSPRKTRRGSRAITVNCC